MNTTAATLDKMRARIERKAIGYTVTATNGFGTYEKSQMHLYPSSGIGSAFQAAQFASQLSGVSVSALRVRVHY
jgi:hypothetical protein